MRKKIRFRFLLTRWFLQVSSIGIVQDALPCCIFAFYLLGRQYYENSLFRRDEKYISVARTLAPSFLTAENEMRRCI